MSDANSLHEIIEQQREAVLQEIRAERSSRWAQLPEDSLIWQALVPAWTLPLAYACKFPTDDWHGIEEIFRQLENAGACRSDSLSGEKPWLSHIMPAQTRTEIIQTINREPNFLKEEAGEIGRRILETRATEIAIFKDSLPENTRRWAEIATRAQNITDCGSWFNSLTEELLGKGQSGELSNWIDVARGAEEVFGAELGFVVARAVRQLELFHRREDDNRRLTKFLERREQIEAFRDLLDNTRGEWALHYLGAGGVGKTMLIRHLTANLSKELNLSAARVDFDYLDPDYPARSPGLLVSYLAEEFRVYAPNTSTVSLLADLTRQIRNLHDSLQVTSDPQLQNSLLDSVFTNILPTFADALRQLSRPLIILDTCEELLKIRIDGTVPPSVEATFRILEALRDETSKSFVPDLRVVFGGRRPLASGGAGWSVKNSPLPPRPYLRIHEIRGFSRNEACKYLGEIENLHALRPEAIDPIIENSSAQVRISPVNHVPPRRAATTEAYNPFNLWLYASWLHEDPELPLNELKTANSARYIEMRIIRRQTNPQVAALLPFVALLGRFDAATLRAASESQGETDFDRIFAELGNLEWINRQAGHILEVDPALHRLLLDYYEKGKTEEFRQARCKTADYLENLTATAERGKIDKMLFLGAYRLLKNEPERALEWWRKIEARFVKEEAYDWLKNVCEAILDFESETIAGGDYHRSGSLTALLLASVYGSYAAALLHVQATGEIVRVWEQARTFVVYALTGIKADESRYDPSYKTAAERLLKRTLINQQTHRLTVEKVFYPDSLWLEFLKLKPGDLDFHLAGTLVGALEATVEYLEEVANYSPPESSCIENFLALLAATEDCGLLVRFAQILYARLLKLAGRVEESLVWLRRAVSGISSQNNCEITAQQWLDWIAPDELEARIRLEFIANAYPGVGAAEILKLVGDQIPAVKTIDTERLGAAILQLRSAIGFPVVESFRAPGRYGHEPKCRAHRLFPTFFAALAEVTAAHGKIEEAVKMLQERSLEAEESVGTGLENVQQADRSLLRIVRRLRLRDEDLGVTTSLNGSADLQDIELLCAIKGLSDPTPDALRSYGTGHSNREFGFSYSHSIFRSAFAVSGENFDLLTRYFKDVIGAAPVDKPATAGALACYLDCLELNGKHRSFGSNPPFPQYTIDGLKKEKIWKDVMKTDSLEKLTLLLRQTALENRKIIDDKTKHRELIDKIGRRRAALITLGEGELLALRMPERAVLLLGFAHHLFREANDRAGELIARICTALALARAGKNVELKTTLSRIKHEFNERFAGTLANLPSWDDLATVAKNPDPSFFTRIAPRVWRPWMVRLVACLVREKDGFRVGPKTKLLLKWIESAYGADSNAGIILPTEFEGWLRKADVHAARSGSDKAKENELQLIVTTGGSHRPGPVDLPLAVIIEGHEIDRIWQTTAEIRLLEPYRETAVDLFGVDRSILTSLEKQNDFRLEVDAAVGGPSWEAILYFILNRFTPYLSDVPRVRRTVRSSRFRPVDWGKIKTFTTWASDRKNIYLAERGLHGMILDLAFDYQSTDSPYDARIFGSGSRPTQILHLVGMPVETSAGVRMNMSAERFFGRENIQSSMSDSLDSSETLLKPENLFKQFPEMAVCLLQGPLREVAGERTHSDRRQAACLRLFAAELSRFGVPLVVTMPSFESEQFERVLKCLAGGFEIFREKEPETPLETGDVAESLLESIGQARQSLTESAPQSFDVLLESALDICIYEAGRKVSTAA